MKNFNNESVITQDIKSMIKKEIEKALKNSQSQFASSYSNIMSNARPGTTEVFSKIPALSTPPDLTNKNSYQKMKNRVNYGFSTDSKTFVNKASSIKSQ